MRHFLLVLSIVLTLCVSVTFAQRGGKAEPNRILFDAGKISAAISGTLSVGQEAEYVFAAVKGQTVTIRNSNRNLFDFRVFNEEFDFETEFESSPTLTFEIPESGDYMFYVRKKAVKTPRTARYSLTLTIR
ncbi:MAG: hypothetical protein KA746_15415 [Pyrinomonadaceae bacterium]|nr:hypothetical protein [Pyrinomonadaceae bacterium]MBP6212911.1 hypothetical protein [Pyrinomonadaceae bacterium]